MVFVAGLSFRARQRFTTYAVGRLDDQKVVRANLRNRTVENGGARRPLAELPRDRWYESHIDWLAHLA